MLGLTRLFLSFVVVYSHAGFPDTGINVGVVAVAIFYAISGALMQSSFANFQARSSRPTTDFLVDRLLKLLPQYWVVLTLTIALMVSVGPSSNVMFMNQEISFEKLLLNYALLPVNYVFEPLSLSLIEPHPLIPPAWSLASEFHFYLLTPMIAVMTLTRFRWLAMACIATQVASVAIDSTAFNAGNAAYRFLPGAMSFFLLGFCHGRAAQSDPHRLLRNGILCVYAAMAAGCLWVDNPPAFALEIAIGGLLALPCLQISRAVGHGTSRWARINEACGKLAYPVFIGHFLAFYINDVFLGLHSPDQSGYAITTVFMCLALAVPLSMMQTRIDRLRFSVRGFENMKAR